MDVDQKGIHLLRRFLVASDSLVLAEACSSAGCASPSARTYCLAFSRSAGSSDLRHVAICVALCCTALSFPCQTSRSCWGSSRPILLSVHEDGKCSASLCHCTCQFHRINMNMIVSLRWCRSEVVVGTHGEGTGDNLPDEVRWFPSCF